MYTEKEVREMLDNYKFYQNMVETDIYDSDSTSVAQYGIEATLPKAKGTTGDKVLVKVINRNKQWRRKIKMIEKMQFIDEHEEYVTDEVNYHILQMMKRGMKHKTIMDIACINSRSNFYGRVNEIVNVYMDVQQGNYS